MKFSIKGFFSKCHQIRRKFFTEEILNGKLHFLCNEEHVQDSNLVPPLLVRLMERLLVV